jgi:hypothetical protein
MSGSRKLAVAITVPDRQGTAARFEPPWGLLLLALVCLGGLAGCGGELAAPTDVPAGLFGAVLAALAKLKDLQFSNGTRSDANGKRLPDKSAANQENDRHKGFFIYRRVAALKQFGINDQALLIQRIEEEFDELSSFVLDNIGTPASPGPLRVAAPDGLSDAPATAAFTCKPEKHLDLNAVATHETGGTVDKKKLGEYRTLRLHSAVAIIWRAAGIHTELWDNNAAEDERLDEDMLQELLDRRLRLVERMEMQANAPIARVKRQGAYPAKQWFDNKRVRIFEYPFFSTVQPSDLVEVTVVNGKQVPVDKAWIPKKTLRGFTIMFDNWIVPTTDIPGRRVATRIRAEHNPEEFIDDVWDVFDNKRAYRRTFTGATAAPASVTLSQGVDQMVQARLNLWDREWWYCDHTISILHLDALRFGLLRRGPNEDPPANGDALLDDIGTKQNVDMPGFFAGLPNGDLNKPSEWTTYKSNSNPAPLFNQQAGGMWFQNLYVNLRDLQVGDHIVFNNHVIYAAVSTDAFRLENAVITSIDSNHRNGTLKLSSLKLSGLGLPSASIQVYAQNMAGSATDALKGIQRRIASFTDQSPEMIAKCFATDVGLMVFQWSPYDDVQDTTPVLPWFVFLPFSDANVKDPAIHYATVWNDVAQMQKSITHSFVDPNQDSNQNGHNPIPHALTTTYNDTQLTVDVSGPGVLFPLFLPVLDDGPQDWGVYLTRRAAASSLPVALLKGVELSAASYDAGAPTGTKADIPGVFITEPSLLPTPIKNPQFFPIAVVRPALRKSFKGP